MASIFVWDGYGRDLHRALQGVVENVKRGRWAAARYAVRRRWFRGEDGEGESVWKRLAEEVCKTANDFVVLENQEDLAGWENVVVEAVGLCDDEHVCLKSWKYGKKGWNQTSLLVAAASVGSTRMVDWVVERGGDLEIRNHLEMTPLFVACHAGHLDVVRMLVERGADVGALGSTSATVLYAAARYGHVEVVEYLLGLGVLDVDKVDVYDRNALGTACAFGHLEVVKLLVENGGADVDVEGKNIHGPIYQACVSGREDLVGYVLDTGSGNGVGKDGGVWVEGLVGAAQKGNVGVVRILLGVGVAVDGINVRGNTALGVASAYGKEDVVKVLLGEGGAGVDVGGSKGKKPLYIACNAKHAGVVELLLAAGADVEGAEWKGEGVVHLARRKGRDDIVEMLLMS